jgi:hypothetical protein
MTISRLPVPDRPYSGKGKVLRVKEGFNPNSSSLGSIVFSMSAALMAAPVVLAAAAAWISSRTAKPAGEPSTEDASAQGQRSEDQQ